MISRTARPLPALPAPSRPRTFAASLALLGAIFFFLTPLARAHDPYDSWSSAVVHPDQVELQVTVAQSTALRLVDPDRNIKSLTPESLEKNRPLFEREGATLYVITSARKRLTVKKIEVELTEENDVIFKLSYSPASPGQLHFHAAFLVKLGEGYGGLIDIALAPNEQLGWEQLSWANPNYEVTVPAPGAAKKK